MDTISATDLADRLTTPVRDVRVTGRLALEGRTLSEPLVFEDCVFEDDVCLDEAMTSSVRLVRCTLPNLAARNVETRGDLVLEHVTARRIVLAGAHVGGSLRLAGARLSGEPALDASSVRVDQDVDCTAGFTALGQVTATGARIDGKLDLTGATLDGLGEYALHAGGLRAGSDVVLDSVVAHGTVWLTGASIDGSLDCIGARLCADGDALVAESLRAGRGAFLVGGFRARGALRLVGATFGGPLSLESAELVNPGDWALNAWGVEIGMGLWCNGLTADGELRLTSARVRGPVRLEAATVSGRGPDGISIHLNGAECDELVLPTTAPPGTIALHGARTRQFTDFGARYRVLVGDFAYDSLGQGSDDLASRLRWLAGAEEGFSPGAYDRLAAVLRAAGREDDARDVAIARERARRRTLHRPGRWGSRFLGATVGHGYRPWRAGAWLAAVVLAGWWLFGSLWREDIAPVGGEEDGFRPLLFSLDAVLPVVNLGQDDRWTIVGGGGQWWYAFSVLAGWVLATVLVAALTARLVRD